ncbi:MAG: hypothetical protein ACT4TC_25495, partial [Myxococcaceae bacterium]
MSERFPETKPKGTSKEDVKNAQEGALTKLASESFVAAQAKKSREALAAAAGMSVAQLDAAEREKEELLDAMRLPPAAPKSDGRIALVPPKDSANAADIAARLIAAEDELHAAEAEVAAAEAADRKAAEQRAAAIERSRQRLGAVQNEQVAVSQQQTARELHERARQLQQTEVDNQSIRSTEAETRIGTFVKYARPLVAKLKTFIGELQAFEAENGSALRTFAQMSWKSTPATWRMQDRVALVDRAAKPAQTLVNDITSILASSSDLVAQAESVFAGQREPHEWLLGRLEQASKNYIGHFQSQLAVLNHEVS